MIVTTTACVECIVESNQKDTPYQNNVMFQDKTEIL